MTIIKFVEKKEVSIITSKQYLDEGNNVGVEKSKPEKIHEKIFPVINDYNKNKYSVDLSYQIRSYHSALRKSNKWHRKLSFNLILNTMINNERIIYNMNNNSKLSVKKFKHDLCIEILNGTEKSVEKLHFLTEYYDKQRLKCYLCYSNKVKTMKVDIAKNKCNKSSNHCVCDILKRHICLKCFNNVHLKKLI